VENPYFSFFFVFKFPKVFLFVFFRFPFQFLHQIEHRMDESALAPLSLLSVASPIRVVAKKRCSPLFVRVLFSVFLYEGGIFDVSGHAFSLRPVPR